MANPSGSSDNIIESAAIRYGLEQLSLRKRTMYLQAEFPHLWPIIEKFIGGKIEYSERALQNLLGQDWKNITKDLRSIGLLSSYKSGNKTFYGIPFLYRSCLELHKGR